jgi:paraquat-inducible protein B
MSTPKPVVSRGRHFSVIWVVPIIAIAVAAWMIYREWRNHGPEITIEFADGNGIEPGKTTLEHKGVDVGSVRSVTLKKDLSGVLVKLRLDRDAAKLAVGGSEFWIVHPEIGLSGIRGLDTLVSGVRLNVRPGSGAPATYFRGLDKTPAPENVEEGRAFFLRTDRLGTLQPQAPVFYRDIRVGSVESSRLTNDATGVLIRIRVQNEYANLVRTNSQFWNAGGIPIKISLFGGAQIRNTSIESLLSGAISFATPDQLGPEAKEGQEFQLETEVNKDWYKWKPAIEIHPPDELPKQQKSPLQTLMKE